MFYVINKSKIYSYLVALSTVVILFVAATTINDIAPSSSNMVQTSTNAVSENHETSRQVNSNAENDIENQEKVTQNISIGK